MAYQFSFQLPDVVYDYAEGLIPERYEIQNTDVSESSDGHSDATFDPTDYGMAEDPFDELFADIGTDTVIIIVRSIYMCTRV